MVDTLVQNLEQQMDRGQFVTTGEIAKRLGVSRQTVVNWIRRGFLPGIKLGGRLVVPTGELARVEEVVRLLNIVDTEPNQATATEIDRVSRSERDRWTWVDQDA